jgi:hypothetical protein
VDARFAEKTAAYYVDLALPFVKNKNAYLDIGCDVGFALKAALGFGFKSAVGIEPNRLAADKAKKTLPPAAQIFAEPYFESINKCVG